MFKETVFRTAFPCIFASKHWSLKKKNSSNFIGLKLDNLFLYYTFIPHILLCKPAINSGDIELGPLFRQGSSNIILGR